ncbi:MAG: 2Fe-2S iron-sulfur cluster-binding protein, partial [Gammaproteobacteria bacterium]|nr:2Fe-2S iron-sulfur cluster-binding protein [Gammaproteobacteria bacterium]
MGFQVTIEPSGHHFENQEGETLLESALRSGISIAYHCSSGSCGECYGRLLEGELGDRKFHDYRFTEQQKGDGAFLLCRNRAASDLVISANELDDPSSIPLQNIETKVYKIDEANGEYLILQLRTPRSRTLQFFAGQTVKLSIPGVDSYSIAVASCPCNGMYLQFHINRNHPHPLVRQLIEKGKGIGNIVVEGPFGERTLNVQYERPLIFIAKDSEFGAIKSLIEQVINLELPQPVRLFWIASDDEHHYMENYCRSWCEQLDDYHF